MKKCWIVVLAALLLCGCSEPQDFETMSDVYDMTQLSEASQVSFFVPEDAAAEVMENGEAGTLYFCEDYCIAVQTMHSGDLEATLRSVTGFSREKLQVIERRTGDHCRYECTWASAGEGGDQVGRAVILDDGNYHYVLSVMASAADAGDLAQTWQSLVDSFTLRTGK